MFLKLGQAVSRHWKLFLIAWVLTIAVTHTIAPPLESVVQDGEFAFMPATVPSRQGEELFRNAFSNELLGSSVVIVARRTSRSEGLQDEDRDFIENVLKPGLEDLQRKYLEPAGPGELPIAAGAATGNSSAVAANGHAGSSAAPIADELPASETHSVTTASATAQAPSADGGFVDDFEEEPTGAEAVADTASEGFIDDTDEAAMSDSGDSAGGFVDAGFEGDEIVDTPATDTPPSAAITQATGQVPIITKVRTYTDKSLGHLLESEDNKASLVLVELRHEFLDKRNHPVVAAIEQLIDDVSIPAGLDLSLSGPATVGRDIITTGESSAEATEHLTVVLVIILLIVIYRAPFLALIPLMTVGISVHLAISVLSILADHQIITLFNGVRVYVTVVLYGAGVDFCVFLIARYKEELDRGATYDEAIQEAVAKVGSAVTASAGTTILGIGMMVFAEFGKFQQAGLAISLSLVFVLLSALTFTPAVLLLCGRWTFWPKMPTERIASTPGWLSPTSMMARVLESQPIERFWARVGEVLLARPATVWIVTVLLMSPFAVLAIAWHDQLSYGLLSELPKDKTSVIGARAVQAHFPPGVTGPVSILIKNPKLDFTKAEGIALIEELTQQLVEHKVELGVTDVRSFSKPLGINTKAQQNEEGGAGLIARGIKKKRVRDFYIADKAEYNGHVTRIDVEFTEDPFSHGSIRRMEELQSRIGSLYTQAVADVFTGGETGLGVHDVQAASSIYYIGATPSIRDLKDVTNRDQIRIDVLVLGAVFMILIVLLRRIATPAYLIISVYFSYLVTLGVTFAVFWALDPTGFAGLDWKVPIFLFTILIAVGEDYNIYLMTRIDEEQKRHGAIQGVVEALGKTGGIISTCGVIMAGTFISLMAGSLVGTDQLGFALAFGVMIDTFLVRPILVPAYLIMLHSGRFGWFGRLLGAQNIEYMPARVTPSLKIGRKR